MDAKEALEGGWGALDKLVQEPTPQDKAETDRAEIEQFELDASFMRCFNSPDGRVVLESLERRYIFVNSYNPGVVNPDQHGHFLEGHRNLVLMIMQRIERAKLGNPVHSGGIEL